MTSTVVQVLGKQPGNSPLMLQFLRWQCRTRQLSMRDAQGKPDDAAMPALTLPGDSEPLGHIITVMSKWGFYSKTPELQHMAKRTNDPAQRRDKALEFFSSTYYQKAHEFSDVLTATFPPESTGAARIEQMGQCQLAFDAYNQKFMLDCKVSRLADSHALYQATWWHNVLFNPQLSPKTIVLAFEPNWQASAAEPALAASTA